MVQPNTIARFDTTDVVALMTETEARSCITAINGHMNSARALLLDLYERRGWVALGYSSWRECAVAEFGKAQRTLYEELEAARIESRICGTPQNEPIPTSQLLPMGKLTPMEQPIAWQEANERTNGKPTARVVEQVVTEMRADPVQVLAGGRPLASSYSPSDLAQDLDEVLDPPMETAQAVEMRDMSRKRPMSPHFTSNTPEWYTPDHIITRVEAVFGHIDLDPCSNSNDPDQANIPALAYWTQADDGLAQPWHGHVYMNPPYGDVISAWVERMIQAHKAGEITSAIALLPARTDTAWFQPLFQYPICWVRGRLRFSNAENSAPFPSVIVYLGNDVAVFREVFEDIGSIPLSTAEATASVTGARAFLEDQSDRLTRFSPAGMVSQTTFRQALAHIRAITSPNTERREES